MLGSPGAGAGDGAGPEGAAGRALAAVLDGATGTVTALLERAAGEPVDADVLAQGWDPAPAGNPLGLAPGARTLRRAVLLRGRATGASYVYACSVLATPWLPGAVVRRLETSSDPIGRVLAAHGLEAARVAVDGPVGPPHDGGDLLARSGGAVVARRYHLVVAGERAADVSEWFLGPSIGVLAVAGRPPVAGG